MRLSTVATAALLLLVLVLAVASILGWWDWKTLIGWRALVDYINPDDATERKEALQVYAVIVAGVIASITAAVGLANLRLTRRNLEQQRELEAERGRGSALQAYYEQMGALLADKGLGSSDEKSAVRELARAQTLTVLRDLDATRKGSLLLFLKAAGLIERRKRVIQLTFADFRDAKLTMAPLGGADLRNTYLQGADLKGAILQGADLRNAMLHRANLFGADLQGADLQGADLQGADLRITKLAAANLEGANLYNADLRDTDLQHTDLESALWVEHARL